MEEWASGRGLVRGSQEFTGVCREPQDPYTIELGRRGRYMDGVWGTGAGLIGWVGSSEGSPFGRSFKG
jgi:hypothetical protein